MVSENYCITVEKEREIDSDYIHYSIFSKNPAI